MDEFLKTAWAEHADVPQTVADRLASSLHLPQRPDEFERLAHLMTHVYGEHLGQWQNGVDLLEALRRKAGLEPGAVGGDPFSRSIAALRYAGGDAAALAGTWLEAERAEYRLARSLLQADQAQAATAHARRCLDLCEQHGAAPFERFFGHAVSALADRALGSNADFETQRQSAMHQLAQLEEADRAACDTTLAELAD